MVVFLCVFVMNTIYIYRTKKKCQSNKVYKEQQYKRKYGGGVGKDTNVYVFVCVLVFLFVCC